MYDDYNYDYDDAADSTDVMIGIELPCKVDQFHVYDSSSMNGFRSLPNHINHKSFKERHLISVQKNLYAGMSKILCPKLLGRNFCVNNFDYKRM